MRFLVIGQGGREHALVKALKASASVTEVHVVPGSDAMVADAIAHSLKLGDTSAWSNFLKAHSFDCVVIGPELPLAEGLADFLRSVGVPTLGPNQTAARLESSKVFAKEFMQAAGVPSARFEVVESKEACLEKAKLFEPPYVLKADGLAAGKGVFICKTVRDLEQACDSLFVQKIFGEAGRKAVLEQFQPGYELSYLVLTNGHDFQPLPIAQDHKRLLDNDEGPNTGGMGVVAPVSVEESLRARIHSEIVEPTLRHLNGLGLLYRGVLYFGIMVTEKGPSLLEYNVRFGDPEAQVILPLLDGDWGKVFSHLAAGDLDTLKWKPMFSACVVLASPGYPTAPENGVVIEGDLGAQTPMSYFLHAGTRHERGRWSTAGGRVLNAIGLGPCLSEAIANAYRQAEKVRWRGLQMRRDIGRRQS